ncbi:carbohydrate ABC transporter permease [Paenibacillus aurantius]|uniref:Carbohydrate ABC transporter permease n=1 Tax=Paenibacillus aurantius TaxID=2918900 RepID=A0AA96RJJ9_9BACL|nr:carbohydrate ABC transporter permease [Paenibacillus aurantius]WNQ13364.1 carbohydrate ABC transporter permease [Paenibacillus aurantius]
MVTQTTLKSGGRIRQSAGDRVLDLFIYVWLIFVAMLVLYPLVYVFSASISNPEHVVTGKMWLIPMDFTSVGYTKLLQDKDVLLGYRNTLFYVSAGTLVNVVMTVLAAYPLSRRDFVGRGAITAFFAFTLFFSGGLIPTYLLIKSLHMVNTFWAIIIPTAVSVLNIVIMRTSLEHGIPNELIESASMDGCGDLRMLFRIVLPLSLPILAVMVLYYAVWNWNTYFNAMIYLNDREKFPLQLFLRDILVRGEFNELQTGEFSIQRVLEGETIKYAMVIVANLPMLLLYPFLQKYFVKGVLIGAIKG